MKFIDLFSGIGGFRIGFEKEGFECVFSSEIDEECRKVYEANYGHIPSGDIRNINVNDILEFDILLASFACETVTPIDFWGIKNIDDRVMEKLFDIISLKSPKIVIIENTGALGIFDNNKMIKSILEKLNAIDYYVEWKVLNARDFKSAENIERLFIVAKNKHYYKDTFKLNFLQDIHYKACLRGFLDKGSNFKYIDTKEYVLFDEEIKYESGEICKGIMKKYQIWDSKGKIYSIDGIYPYISYRMIDGYIYIPEENRVRELTIDEIYRIKGFSDSFKKSEKLGEAYNQIIQVTCIPIAQAIARKLKIEDGIEGIKMDCNYDRKNKKSIEEYARRLLNSSLNKLHLDTENGRFNNEKSKGKFGQTIEEEYFGYKVNSRQEADFDEVGVELKVCPLRTIKPKPTSDSLREKMGYSAKERIVLSIIDYFKLNDETWDKNSLMKKCKELLLMFYMHEKDVAKEDLIFRIISLWTPSEQDLNIIKNDWNTISTKVKNGKAHEISEGDTMYLGACTKGSTAEKSMRNQPNSNLLAQQRAFSYKRSYVDYIIEELLRKELYRQFKPAKVLSNKDMLFDKKIYNVFNVILNKNLEEIINMYSIKRERKAKNFIRLVIDDVCKVVFGDKLDNFEEFKKANIEIKTILLKPNGMPKESMSFEQINYCEIVNEDWETSTIKDKFENKKHLWIIFKSKINFEKQSELNLDNIVLCKVMFWNMPILDLNNSMYKVWVDTTNKIKNGDYNNFIKISDGEIAHIRPKGQDVNDLALTPQGTMERKKCFWLNAKYVKEQIEKEI
ncbi:Sau3AI family type II restriction endonuclease [Clostridium sp. CX1]|uniref:Sau3AI family type II restriction endonuclease n=1 Tax=Clostridium sp. CX1 TaxID=2978346 RepID=UPI0021BFE0D4|nr:Sau3AI family type II restriction endonuclease [Clostridium sp. CX1]MCT8977895.1 Sau3AI family type II restriction endonuclease [Clostridium sp. CX1]